MTLLRNDAYVALPVTAPDFAGFLREVDTWNAVPVEISPGPQHSTSTICHSLMLKHKNIILLRKYYCMPEREGH